MHGALHHRMRAERSQGKARDVVALRCPVGEEPRAPRTPRLGREVESLQERTGRLARGRQVDPLGEHRDVDGQQLGPGEAGERRVVLGLVLVPGDPQAGPALVGVALDRLGVGGLCLSILVHGPIQSRPGRQVREGHGSASNVSKTSPGGGAPVRMARSSTEGVVMRSMKTLAAAGALLMSGAVLVACGGGGGGASSSSAAPESSSAAPAPESSSAAPESSSAAPAADGLLAQILETGVLRVSTDPAYPPQSSYDEATGEWQGFDIDVANEIATRMGVTTQWETPAWDVITAGNWNDRWDVSVGSMSITDERAQVLDFTEPYYFTPAGVAVNADSDIQSIDQLAGKRIGVCGACTYEYYLNRTLSIPGFAFEFLVPEDVEIVTYDTDTTALQDLKLGRVDAMVSAVPLLEEAIKKGKEIRLVGDPVFLEPLAVAADKSSSLPVDSLVAELNRIIQEMHADGTLSELSMKWYGVDITKGPGA